MNDKLSSEGEIAVKFMKLKEEKNAVLLAHYYQIPEIQDIADYTGDSLGLSQQAATTNADIIVFAGVHFMAETAKILSPAKKVLLPDLQAGCSLADSCPPERLREFRDQHPEHIVISYINSSAAVKTMSDIICTSGNAVQIVESFPREQPIIFAPDKNLGAYINAVTEREMLLWDGSCEVHDILTTERVIQLKAENQDALLIAHPECKGAVLAMADFIGSTTALLDFTVRSEAKKFIVATETGIIHQMQKKNPGKTFIVVTADETCSCNDCPYMKLNTMQKLLNCLEKEYPEIIMDEETIRAARRPIERMLDISRKAKLIK